MNVHSYAQYYLRRLQDVAFDTSQSYEEVSTTFIAVATSAESQEKLGAEFQSMRFNNPSTSSSTSASPSVRLYSSSLLPLKFSNSGRTLKWERGQPRRG